MRLVGTTSIVVETTFSDRNRGLLPAPCHSTLTHDVPALCSPTVYELSRSWLGWYVGLPSWANETRDTVLISYTAEKQQWLVRYSAMT